MPTDKKFQNLKTFLADAKPIEYSPTADDLKRKLKLVRKYNVLPEQNAFPDEFLDEETGKVVSELKMNEAAGKAVSQQFTQKALEMRLERSIDDLEELSQPHTLGERINYYRAQCDLSMQELADAVHITKTMVNQHINHAAVPKTAVLARYTEVFTLRLNQVITIKDLTG